MTLLKSKKQRALVVINKKRRLGLNKHKKSKYINKNHKYNNNQTYNKQITLALASVICLLINYLAVNFAKNNQEFIEFSYSRGIYKAWSAFLNVLNRGIAFSISEVIYIMLIIVCIVFLGLSIRALVHKEFRKFLTSILIIFLILSINVVYFQLSWGLNNYRYSAEKLFAIEAMDIEVEDLARSFEYLVKQGNKYKELSMSKETPITEDIMKEVYIGYERLSEDYDFISNERVRVKPLLISGIFSASAYTGIYLPPLAEANINYMPHISTISFTASHELAHQKGFAGEDEANFIGFLACTYHDDPYIVYSGYLAMMTYVGNSLYSNDKDLYLEIANLRSEELIKDIKLRREFWDTHTREKSQEVLNNVNDAFLKANNQPDGIVNYSKVTELFVKAFLQGVIVNEN